MDKNYPNIELIKWDFTNEKHVKGYFNMLSNQKIVDLVLYPKVNSYEEAKAEIKTYENDNIFAVSDEITKEIIGFIGLIEDENGFNKNVKDMGKEPTAVFYAVAEDHWGKNYASAALKKIISYAFKNTDTECLIAYHVPHNKGSYRVLQKSGFKVWKHQIVGSDGRPRCPHFLTKKEYENSRGAKGINIAETLVNRLVDFCNG